MRTLPAVDLDIPVQPGWTWLVDALGLLSFITIVAWWLSAVSAPAEPWRTAWLVIGVLIILLALHARRSRPCRLRWDGRQWLWAPAAQVDDLPLVAGRLGVMLDLQVAMLLRFVPDGAHHPAKVRWVSVHRGSRDVGWHELRCAVFSRQTVGPEVADDRTLETKQ